MVFSIGRFYKYRYDFLVTMTGLNFQKPLKYKGLCGIIIKTGEEKIAMNRIIHGLTAYARDLQSALFLECSREDAVKMGTIREWKAINQKIQGLIRRSEKLENYIQNSLMG